MTKINSTAPARSRKAHKPAKPHKDFPLFPHATKRWAKKVLGKMHYFGPWDKPQEALDRWLAEKDDLLAGRTPRSRPRGNGPTLRDLCNQFLNTKRMLLESDELSSFTWDAYEDVCEELISMFGVDRLLTDLLPEDFEALRTRWAASGRVCRKPAKKGKKREPKKWGAVRLASEINRARVVFNYAYKNGLLDRPMRYGEGFKRPSKKTLRLERAEKGPKMFEAAELQRMLKGAGQPMKAMLLLAINAGFGNNDVALLPMSALDLAGSWINYPRPKTGIDRKCPLWKETVKALREWLKVRPASKDDANADLVFLTVRGGSWAKGSGDRPVTHECRKLLDGLGINGHRNFYAIRHTFETIAGESRDQIAVDAIMGHVDPSMGAVYRERISDERLLAVSNFVRTWLFGTGAKG